MEQLKYFLLKNKRTLIAFIGSFLAIIIVFGCLFLVMTPVQRWRMFNNHIGYKSLAMWHSLRKIPNVVHFPYWFRDSKLDAYYITVSSTDLVKLNGSLPLSDDGLTYGHLYEDDKSYVSATFKDPLSGYESKVKMRYRGLVDNNWSSEKKALRIKFDKADFFEGRAALNLMIPGDREYFAGLLSAYRAKKFGVFTPPFKPVKVFINGRDFGVYFASEPWSKELLARSGYVDTDNIFSKIDKEAVPGYSVFFEQNLPDWKSYTFKSTDGAASEFEELKALLSLTNNADDKEFAEKIGTLVDLDKFYHWQLINTLIGSAAQNDLENIVLIF
jgi:spore coat protein CotH